MKKLFSVYTKKGDEILVKAKEKDLLRMFNKNQIKGFGKPKIYIFK